MTINMNKKLIIVAAAIIMNDKNELLLVRKQNTSFFMQVGGKIELNESAEDALVREIKEEILVQASIINSLGVIHTMAANESGFELQAHVFEVEITEIPYHSSEIAELAWIDLHNSQNLPIAPLTEEFVLPYLKEKYSEII